MYICPVGTASIHFGQAKRLTRQKRAELAANLPPLPKPPLPITFDRWKAGKELADQLATRMKKPVTNVDVLKKLMHQSERMMRLGFHASQLKVHQKDAEAIALYALGMAENENLASKLFDPRNDLVRGLCELLGDIYWVKGKVDPRYAILSAHCYKAALRHMPTNRHHQTMQHHLELHHNDWTQNGNIVAEITVTEFTLALKEIQDYHPALFRYVAIDAVDLAKLYVQQKQHSKARQYYRHALHLMQSYGPSTPGQADLKREDIQTIQSQLAQLDSEPVKMIKKQANMFCSWLRRWHLWSQTTSS